MKRIFHSFRLTKHLVLVMFLVVAAAGVAVASDAITVAYGTNQSITAFSLCKRVTNASPTGLSVYVPNTSAAEWASFYGSPPTGVTAGACTTGAWTLIAGPICSQTVVFPGVPQCTGTLADPCTIGAQCVVTQGPGASGCGWFLQRKYECRAPAGP